jgi:hypothetical protein
MTDNITRYDDLRAIFINCTLKRSPELSHTGGLIDLSRTIMEKQGVTVDVLRAVDHDIATGVWPDMTEHGWATDDWPAIYPQVLAADILVTWNLLHRMLRDAGGVPAHGNQRSGWAAGCRFDFPNPDDR